MRWLLPGLVCVAGCKHPEAPLPPSGTSQREARVGLAGTGWSDEVVLADSTGNLTYLGAPHADHVVKVDWQARTAAKLDGVGVYGEGPLLQRIAPSSDGPETAALEWAGGAGVPRPAGWTSGGAWLGPVGAEVPLVTNPQGEKIILEGWRVDGTRAWHVEPAVSGDRPMLLAHLGDLIVIQTVGEHTDAEGWQDGVTFALDARTGAERWKVPARDPDIYPCAQAAAAHGDELALVYEMPARIEVIARADGALRRTVKLDRTILRDSVGFDGDVVWSYAYHAAHDNPGSHMTGTFPSDPSPASCEYQVWDTRHDRGHTIRTEANLPAEWITSCEARALVPLADGGVQVLLVPRFETDALRSIWFDRPP